MSKLAPLMHRGRMVSGSRTSKELKLEHENGFRVLGFRV